MRRALIAAFLLAACGDSEEIIRVRPILSVCARADAPAEECDRPIDLGERPITVPHAVTLFLFDRGEGALIVSSIGGTEVTSALEVPHTVAAGTSIPLPLTITPATLGESKAVLSIESDDPERNPYSLDLLYSGVPKPVPKIELCIADACGTDVAFDFGLVRRTQTESVVIQVKNVGTASLAIGGVELVGASSQENELSLASSTRPGTLLPGAAAEVVAVYQPQDGVADHLEILFATDDPATPEARVVLDARSDANAAPVADARQVDTGSTSLQLAVEELVVLDGSRSSDPEGDPLRFTWTLSVPARSRAQLDDPAAGLVTFVPDVAGNYRAELVVTDSLEQTSEVAAVVLIEARPKYAFRARLAWQGGGDLDLHLVADGGDLFGAEDCYFDNPMPAFGAELRNDVESPPGGEEIVFEVPGPGIYRLYVQYFDDLGLGAADATVEVIFDDASQPAFTATETMTTAMCNLWYVGELSFPPAAFQLAAPACP
jgi:hypothetical protein